MTKKIEAALTQHQLKVNYSLTETKLRQIRNDLRIGLKISLLSSIVLVDEPKTPGLRLAGIGAYTLYLVMFPFALRFKWS